MACVLSVWGRSRPGVGPNPHGHECVSRDCARSTQSAVRASRASRKGGQNACARSALARRHRRGKEEKALANLAYTADNHVAIARAGAIEPLVALVRGGTLTDETLYAAFALRRLATNADNEVGAIEPPMALVRGGADKQKEHAAGALSEPRGQQCQQVAIHKCLRCEKSYPIVRVRCF